MPSNSYDLLAQRLNGAQAPKLSPLIELGTSGLQHSGGFITDEFLRNLQGQQGIKAYREMADNSPIIGAVLFAIRMLARETGWRIEPFDEDADDRDAVFVDEALHDMSMSWDDTLDEVLSELVYGFQISEIVYKRRQGEQRQPGRSSTFTDGKIAWRKWAPRSQLTIWRWDLDEAGGVKGVLQYDPYRPWGRGYVYLPIEKLLLFRPFSYLSNPEGRSILRNAYTSYYYAKQIAEIEAIGIERDLAGLPVVKVPAEVINDSTQLAKWKKIVQDIKRNQQAGVVIPSDMWPETKSPMFELTLLSAGGERQISTNEVLMRHETRMAQTVLADFIQLGQQPNGSRSLADSKGAMFGTAMGALLDGIAEVINRHAIPRLFRLNGMPVDKLPRFVFDDIEYDDVNLWAEAMAKLAGAGMPLFPDPAIEAVVRAKLDLPEQTEEELAEREREAEDEKARMEREAEAMTQQAEMAAKEPPPAPVAKLDTDELVEKVIAALPVPVIPDHGPQFEQLTLGLTDLSERMAKSDAKLSETAIALQGVCAHQEALGAQLGLMDRADRTAAVASAAATYVVGHEPLTKEDIANGMREAIREMAQPVSVEDVVAKLAPLFAPKVKRARKLADGSVEITETVRG